MRIRPRLMFTTMTVIGAMLLSGGIGLMFTNYVTDISDALVEQQTTPILKIQQMEKHALEVWLRFISHASVTDPDVMQRIENEIPEYKQKMDEFILDFESSTINRTNTVQEVTEQWQNFVQNWHEFLEKADNNLTLSQEFMKQEALEATLLGEVRETYSFAVFALEGLTDKYYKQMQELQRSADNAENTALLLVAALTSIISLLILIMMNRFTNGLLTPLESANKQLRLLAEGQIIEQDIPIYHDDEVAEISGSIRRLQQSAENIVKQSNAIAQGDYSKDIELRSEHDKLGLALRNMTDKLREVMKQAKAISQGDYSGEIQPLSANDELGTALADMTAKLRAVTTVNQEQDWLKTGQNQLNEIMSGEQNVVALAKNVISKLSAYLSVPVGAFYLAVNDGEDTRLKLIAGYAYAKRKHAKTEFELGDGLVGQSALEGQQIQLAKAPEDYLSIQSGLGEAAPAHILVTPFFYEDSLKGVIELGAFTEFTELQHELIELMVPRIGIMVNVCEAHTNMSKLLQQSQAQTEQLQTQAEELQSQSEEMQSQQEELRQANEELAEHMNELEQQRNEIHQKNSVLEETQAEMRESQRMLSGLMDNLPGMVYQLHPDGTFRFASRGAQGLLEYSPEELLSEGSRKMTDLIHPEDQERIAQSTREMLKKESGYKNIYRILTKSGEVRWVTTNGRAITDDSGKILYTEALVTDITELKAIQDSLENSNRYKSEFLANMSHELRTPLNSLLILSQLLAENKAGNLNDQQVTQAETINASGRDLLNLINDILDLSKVEAGKLDIQIDNIELSSLGAEFIRKFEHVADEKGLTFTVEQEDNLPDTIFTDQQRLKQILNNLLSNAFKFTEKGGVSLHIARAEHLPLMLEGDFSLEKTLIFQVRDTGIGIPGNKQAEVFEAFQQADGTVSRRFGGTGLGLSISRELARLLGGDIELQSELDEGSTFTLYLPEKALDKPTTTEPEAPLPPAIKNVETAPRTQTSPVVTRQPSEPPAKPREPANVEDDRENIQENDKSLLIVEDDAEFAKTLCAIAREQKFKCLVALDGQEGLNLAETYQPDAIILDIGLPKVDGWSVIDHLKNTPATRHIPIHCISGREDDLTARRMGAIGYLLKPVSMGELVGALHRIEQFINTDSRKLLILSSDSEHQERIKSSIEHQDLNIETLSKIETATTRLKNKDYGCLIVDIDFAEGQGISVLEALGDSEIPVILHSERELTDKESIRLRQLEDKLVVKPVYSPERLLEESTLFLHQIEATLPEEKRRILTLMHNKEALLTGKNVLIADDDMRNFFALAAALEDRDMNVISAKNGEEALQLLQERTFDIVLMDIMMPVMDGYETMRKIRAQHNLSNLPIIALTAKAMKDDKAKCIEAGANDYLSKPVDTHKLLSLMRVWLYR